jgi:hypothetical protein
VAEAPRLGGSSPAEWAGALGGGLLLAAGLVWWLRGDAPAPPEPVELTAAPASQPPLAQQPAPALAPTPTPDQPTALPTDLTLRGIIRQPGREAAIIEAAGRQRLVTIGGLAAPGVRLVALEAEAALLDTPAGPLRLAFADSPAAAPAAGPAATAATRAVTSLRIALTPRRDDGNTTGFIVRAESPHPALAAAGLQPGDVIIEIDGVTMESQERLEEAAGRLETSTAPEIVFERGGAVRRAKVPVAAAKTSF